MSAVAPVAAPVVTTASKPVVVFIHAGNCGACVNFKPQWPSMKKELESIAVLHDIALPEMSESGNPKYYKRPEMISLVRWFPTFLIMTSEVYNTTVPFSANVFGSIIIDGQMRPDQNMAMTPTNFKKWISEYTEKTNKTEKIEKAGTVVSNTSDGTSGTKKESTGEFKIEKIESTKPIIDRKKVVTSKGLEYILESE